MMKTKRYSLIAMSCFACMLSACDDSSLPGKGDAVAELGFTETSVNQFENVTQGSIKIRLSKVASETIKLRVAIQTENNARENSNYFIQQKELIINKGEQEVELDYVLVDDKITNQARSVVLSIVEVDGASIDAEKASVTLNILDDESELAVGFVTNSISCRERELGSKENSYLVNIPIKLSGRLSGSIKFDIVTKSIANCSEDVNYRVLKKSIDIENIDQDEISLPIEIIDDEQVNSDRCFELEIANVVGGKLITAQKRFTVTILNDDLGVFFNKERITVYEDAQQVIIPVKALWPVEEEVRLRLKVEGNAIENTDYILEKEVVIPIGQDSVAVPLTILHDANITPDRNLAISIEQLSSGAQVYNDSKCDVTINDIDTPISMTYADLSYPIETTDLKLPFTLSTPLTHSVKVNVALTGVSEDVKEDIQLLSPEIEIPAGQTSGVIRVKVRKDAPELFNFGVKLSQSEGATINGEKNTLSITQFDRSTWTIPEVSSETASDGGGKNMLLLPDTDTDYKKFWHSSWSPVVQLPHHLIVDMQKASWINRATIIRRKDNTDTKVVEFYGSLDQEVWTKMGSLDFGGTSNKDGKKSAVFDQPYHVRFVKIVVTASNRAPFASIARFYLNREDL